MPVTESLPGQFLTFEGIDGAGKSTHIGALADALRAQGRHVTQTREPGGTPLAEQLRELLLHQAMDPLSEVLLMFAARRDHLINVIEPALQQGHVVLCDRFTDATFAYQGHGRGFDLQVLGTLEQWVQTVPALAALPTGPAAPALRQPDLTFWFDVPPEVAAARLAGARSPDKFEALPVTFFSRVAAGYAARCAAAPHRFARIDAQQSLEQVWAQLLQACRTHRVLP
jgi:dTMP kinase